MSSTTMRRDLTGQRFGRLVALQYVRREEGPNAWLCLCDCGVHLEVIVASLTTGNTRSCGCLHREETSERFKKHGARGTAEYEIWCGIIKRCENPATEGWEYYGGRGISIHPSWRHDFAAFLAHVGLRPSPAHSIDRIDTNGNYEPGNVRWATPVEQAGNRRPRRREVRPCA